jgi:hypothetical protein
MNTTAFKNCKDCNCLTYCKWNGRKNLVPGCAKFDIGDIGPELDGCTFYEDKESEDKGE